MNVLENFRSWDQEIDLWFTNHEPLIPTLLAYSEHCEMSRMEHFAKIAVFSCWLFYQNTPS